MIHSSPRRAVALAVTLALLLPATAIAAPPADGSGRELLAWATSAWQQLLAFFAGSGYGPAIDPDGTEADLGPGIDPDGVQAPEPTTESNYGPAIDPNGVQAPDPTTASDLGPDIDPNGVEGDLGPAIDPNG